MGTGKFLQFLTKGVEVIGVCTKHLWQWALAAVLSACWAENRDLSHCSRCSLEALFDEICLISNSRTVGIIYTFELAKMLICLRGKKKKSCETSRGFAWFSCT